MTPRTTLHKDPRLLAKEAEYRLDYSPRSSLLTSTRWDQRLPKAPTSRPQRHNIPVLTTLV
ncbi:hypothetical protein AMTR_s00005p00244890 [Amborella trichopoda]|uniref:Uncharacterized protein n=1 Tax=Amborella trichopoda TaxID=13333 RepID=W1PAE7_AMBTC|nr:hypothetical protein AMTR_s00005p00244890 [Amborella trichopoda]